MNEINNLIFNIFMFPFEKLALHKRRQELIGKVSGNVLEIGSGGGVNFNYYKKELISKLTIIDLKFNKSIKSHKLNKEMDINYLIANAEELPFKDGEIDVMTVCASFHHFPNPQNFAKESARVMKSEGYIYITEIYLPAILRTICNPFLKFSKAGDVKFYSPNEIISLFENNGFVKDDVKINGKIQIIKLKRK